MKLYIKIQNNQPIDHPVFEPNLLEVWQVNEITPELLTQKGYAPFERRGASISQELLSEDGYEMCDDGIVRNIITTRELSQEEKADLWVRRQRDYELYLSDWSQLPDNGLSAEKRAEWATYRQQLRDMTTTYANIQNPSEIIVPVKPTK
jgi:hypothetical protein